MSFEKREFLSQRTYMSDGEMIKPTDKGSVVYKMMLWFGVGNLFPWNAFITAAAYFASRFCNTAFGSSFENYFSIGFTVSQLLGLLYTIKYQNRYSLHSKIVFPLILYGLIFAITSLFVLISGMDPTLLFWLTMVSTMLSGLCAAPLSGGLFGLAAVFPPAYTAALMNGQGLAGLTVSIADVLTTVAQPQPPGYCDDDEIAGAEANECTYVVNYSALSYFLIATLVLFSCIAIFYALRKLPYYE